MSIRRTAAWACAAAAALVAATGSAQELTTPPARPPVDAPELAKLGAHPVGVARAVFVQPAQADPLQGVDRPAVADRRLALTIWYPAAAAGRGIVYRTALSGADGRDVAFSVPGIATADAVAARGRFPLVILAHGYGNTPELLAWLGENLASKGYLVVAPAFRDPPIGIRTAAARAGPIARRPLDIAFVAAEAQRRSRASQGIFAAADADRTALIGYSMGGYGVLTAAGAPLDPALGAQTRGILAPFAAGGAQAASLAVANVKAVVAIAPASRFADAPAWAAPGVGAIPAPTLYIVGDHDQAVGYDAVRGLFAAQRRASRYLLTIKQAGHSIALSGAPAAMRTSFWDLDWLEDGVWRKDRLLAIQAHFITAFLDRYVKDDRAKASYLDGLVEESDAGRWRDAPIGRYPGYSPGPPVATVWKVFQPSRTTGLRFEALGAR